MFLNLLSFSYIFSFLFTYILHRNGYRTLLELRIIPHQNQPSRPRVEVGSIVFSVSGWRLDEDILQNKQHRENIHCGGDTLEVTTQCIQHHVADHTQQNTVRNRIYQRHHHDRNKCGDRLCIIIKRNILDGAHHKQTYDNQYRSGCSRRNRQAERLTQCVRLANGNN